MSEEQIQEETQANETSETPTEQIVTEELAEKLGVSKTLVGKPLDDLGKSIRELSTDYARTKSRLKEVESQKQEKAEKPNLSAPDPLNFEKDEDFQQAQRVYTESVVAKQLEPYTKQLQAQQQKLVMDSIQNELPEGMQADQVANEWMESVNLTQADLQVFGNNIDLLKDNIVNFASARQLKEVKSHIEKDSGDIAMKKIRQSLRANKKDIDLNSVDKTKAVKTDRISAMTKRIIDRQTME